MRGLGACLDSLTRQERWWNLYSNTRPEYAKEMLVYELSDDINHIQMH